MLSVLVAAVLLAAAVVTYRYGLPRLQAANESCRFGGGTRTFGCSSSFGSFMTWVALMSCLAIGAIWNKFGRW
ncbi:MAG: hypothetical protein AB1832_16405 [Pseudomonadota bacterium]